MRVSRANECSDCIDSDFEPQTNPLKMRPPLSDGVGKGGLRMRHHTKDKGDLAVGQVIADLVRNGVQVLLPISEHLPFDLVAVLPLSGDLCRIQVKYVSLRNGKLGITLRNTHADRHGIHHKRIRLDTIDAIAVFCPEADTVYYVRRDEIPDGCRRELNLRLNPARNGQVRRIRLAANFDGAKRIFGPVAQWIEPPASNRLGGGSIPSGPAKLQSFSTNLAISK